MSLSYRSSSFLPDNLPEPLGVFVGVETLGGGVPIRLGRPQSKFLWILIARTMLREIYERADAEVQDQSTEVQEPKQMLDTDQPQEISMNPPLLAPSDPELQPEARQPTNSPSPPTAAEPAALLGVGTSSFRSGGVDLSGQIRAVFELFDSDGSGTVDEKELAAAMIALGLSASKGRGTSEREAVRRLLDSVDKDNSRSMDLEEFSTLMQVAWQPWRCGGSGRGLHGGEA
jgi:hypothetical protein